MRVATIAGEQFRFNERDWNRLMQRAELKPVECICDFYTGRSARGCYYCPAGGPSGRHCVDVIRAFLGEDLCFYMNRKPISLSETEKEKGMLQLARIREFLLGMERG